MGGEVNGHGHGERVQLPSQDNLPYCPGGITFQHLLDRHRLLSMWVIAWTKATQDFIQGMQKHLFDVPPMDGTALQGQVLGKRRG
jgi:hypothetical protein